MCECQPRNPLPVCSRKAGEEETACGTSRQASEIDKNICKPTQSGEATSKAWDIVLEIYTSSSHTGEFEYPFWNVELLNGGVE